MEWAWQLDLADATNGHSHLHLHSHSHTQWSLAMQPAVWCHAPLSLVGTRIVDQLSPAAYLREKQDNRVTKLIFLLMFQTLQLLQQISTVPPFQAKMSYLLELSATSVTFFPPTEVAIILTITEGSWQKHLPLTDVTDVRCEVLHPSPELCGGGVSIETA